MTIHVSKFDNSIILHTSSGKALGVNNMHFEADYLQQQNLVTHTAQGRGTVYFFGLANTQLVLRHYKRGGLVAKLNDDKFIYNGIENTRSYKELAVLQLLREANVNVPEPIAGRIVKSGLFYTADIISKVIDAALELHELLQKDSVIESIWQDIGIEIRKMHNAQLCHYDINVKNILLANQDDKTVVHLLDFDKCEIRKGNDWKTNNLDRLQRSLVKQSNLQPTYNYHQNDWKSLLAGYNI
jgi:3-deoxy-D-manno-octulosonic acid kinase